MWGIRKWPFPSAVARQAPGAPSLSGHWGRQPWITPPLGLMVLTAGLKLCFGRLELQLLCWLPQGGSWQQEECCFHALEFFCTGYIFYLCDVGLHIYKLLRGGQLSLGCVCSVCRPVHNRLLSWVPQALVDHKNIQHHVHRRRSLQEVALVKDGSDICFHVYSNELLLLHVNSACYWLLCKGVLVSQTRAFGRSLSVRRDFFSCFFPAPFLLLKKSSKHIPRSLWLLPWKGCIFVLLFIFVHLILVAEVLCWRPFFSKLTLLYNIGIYLMKEKCVSQLMKKQAAQ